MKQSIVLKWCFAFLLIALVSIFVVTFVVAGEAQDTTTQMAAPTISIESDGTHRITYGSCLARVQVFTDSETGETKANGVLVTCHETTELGELTKFIYDTYGITNIETQPSKR